MIEADGARRRQLGRWSRTHPITEPLSMARVFNGSHSFTCHIHEWNEPYRPLPSQRKLILIYRPRRDERLSWPRHQHGESTMDRYVTEITVISCSDRHASPGNWKRSRPLASNSRPLGPKATTLTTMPPRHPRQIGLRWYQVVERLINHTCTV